jgi:hypothetical protein
VRLWRPAFVLGFVGVWCLARLVPFARFVLPPDFDPGFAPDVVTVLWAVLPSAFVVALGHGWLLHTRGVAQAWTFMPATLLGGALAGAGLGALVGALGDTLPMHPLGTAAGAFTGLVLGFFQWLSLSPGLVVRWRWWATTTFAMAAAGALVEFGRGSADVRNGLLVASALVLAGAQLLALRRKAPATLERGARG